MTGAPRRASRWEIVGAWLHVWTPPRGVEVPAPPLRRIALVAGLVLTALAGAVAAIAPRIDRGKAGDARRDAREEAIYVRTETARLRRDQRLVRGNARLDRSAQVSVREAQLTRAVAVAVAAEVRRRHVAGELESPPIASSARCRRRTSSTARILRLECLSPTSYVDRGDGRGRAGSIGYPFLVRASLATGDFAFCKSNPQAGENFARLGNRAPPAMPSACAQ